jgi:hypothetical protein
MSAQKPAAGNAAVVSKNADAAEGEITVEQAFQELQEAMKARADKRTSMLRTFRKLVESTILTLRGFNVFSVEEWDGGFSFTIGEFGFVMQLAEFDDGRMWPVTIWVRHDDVEVWKRAEEGDVSLSADAEDQIIFGSEAMDIDAFIAKGLFKQLTGAVKGYTVTEEDAEEGWTDEDLFED